MFLALFLIISGMQAVGAMSANPLPASAAASAPRDDLTIIEQQLEEKTKEACELTVDIRALVHEANPIRALFQDIPNATFSDLVKKKDYINLYLAHAMVDFVKVRTDHLSDRIDGWRSKRDFINKNMQKYR